MPKIDKKSTLLRQWEMMRMLTVSRWDRKRMGVGTRLAKLLHA
jgi:hypothetical protein